MLMMAATYEQYCNGIKNSFRLLAELRDYEEFDEFLQEPPLEAGQPTISGFIQKPLEHIKNLVLNLQKILSLTPLGHQDFDNLSQVIEGRFLSVPTVYSDYFDFALDVFLYISHQIW
jgi:regulator of G-protein signaling 3